MTRSEQQNLICKILNLSPDFMRAHTQVHSVCRSDLMKGVWLLTLPC